MKVTAARAIVEVMKEEGVEKAFCVPGESYLSIIDELYDEDKINLISGRQEGGVAFMAEGYAKASGKTGVCFATRGPGATNLSIGLHTAHHDSTPLVAFIGQVESYFSGREAFQEINMESHFRDITKWSVEIRDASRVSEIVHRAFHIARSGRPGPVLISLPEDILDQMIPKATPYNGKIHSSPRPDSEAVKEAYNLLKKAKKPIMIAGGGIRTTQSRLNLVRVVEKLGIPVATATRRMDAFPNEHKNYVGTLWSGAPAFLNNTFEEADVVVVIGSRLSQATTNNYKLINKNSKLIHIDISNEEINKVYKPTIGIVADSEQFLLDLLSQIEKEEYNVQSNDFAEKLGKRYQVQSKPEKIYKDDYVDLEGLIFDMNKTLPKNTIISSDSGNYLGWLLKYYKFTDIGTSIAPTSGAMGYGLPAAIGAKLANPDRIVISFSGDGGFMMTIQELETAIRYDIPIIAIVANNNMYGTIRTHQEIRFPKRPIGTKLSNPNFVEIIKSMNGHGETVNDNESFIPALERAIASNKPAVIEVLYDPNKISVDKTIEQLHEN